MKPEDLDAIEKRGARCLFHKCVCGSDVDALCTALRKAWDENGLLEAKLTIANDTIKYVQKLKEQLETAKKVLGEGSAWIDHIETGDGQKQIHLRRFDPKTKFNDSTFAGLFLSMKYALAQLEELEKVQS